MTTVVVWRAGAPGEPDVIRATKPPAAATPSRETVSFAQLTRFAGLEFALPSDWHSHGESSPDRAEYRSSDGDDRLVAVRRTLAAPITIEALHEALELKREATGSGRIGPISIDHSSGQNRLRYTERNLEQGEIGWQVLLVGTAQVSVGCQGATSASACAMALNSLRPIDEP